MEGQKTQVNTNETIEAPSRLVWQRFKKNRLAFVSLCFIAFIMLLAILGYLVIPDQTSFSNNQHIELATLRPGTRVTMVIVPNNSVNSNQSWFKTMLYGKNKAYSEYPIDSFYFANNDLVIIRYGSRECGQVYTEHFDKAAKILGLPYPGGPLIDKYAQTGNLDKFSFPKSKVPDLNYSFSGIKTSFLYFIQNAVKENPKFIEQFQSVTGRLAVIK